MVCRCAVDTNYCSSMNMFRVIHVWILFLLLSSLDRRRRHRLCRLSFAVKSLTCELSKLSIWTLKSFHYQMDNLMKEEFWKLHNHVMYFNWIIAPIIILKVLNLHAELSKLSIWTLESFHYQMCKLMKEEFWKLHSHVMYFNWIIAPIITLKVLNSRMTIILVTVNIMQSNLVYR